MLRLDISNCGIGSLRDYFDSHPEHAGVTYLDCSDNQLTTLVGCPNGVVHLSCRGNQLSTLVGCPPGVTYLDCRNCQLTTLIGCPNSGIYIDCSGNQLDPVYNSVNFKNFIEREKANALAREKCVAESYLLFLRCRFFHQPHNII